MKSFLKRKSTGPIAILISILLIVIVKAATPYSVSVSNFNDSEFPRVQIAMKISGDTTGLFSKHIEILEGGSVNVGPQVLLPPHSTPSKINLNVLVDTSGRTSDQQDLIRTNLKGLVQYLFETDMGLAVKITSFSGQSSSSNTLQGSINAINALNFSDSAGGAIDGFEKISAASGAPSGIGGQKVLLVVNGSNFEDEFTDNTAGAKTQKAIKDVNRNGYLTFVLGHPLRKIHAIKADDMQADFSDFSHSVPGGYLGGFGADLTSMIDLLKMQNSNDFVLQYYSTRSTSSYVGSQALLKILGNDAHTFTHGNSPSKKIFFDYLPENEIALEDATSGNSTNQTVPIEVDLVNYGKMINTVELNYVNGQGSYEKLPLVHQRSSSTQDTLRYKADVPADIMENEDFSYHFSVETPYISVKGDGYSVPVNAYNGIILSAQTVNGNKVIWTWTVPPEIKAKKYEVWMGDKKLDTVKEKRYEIPIDADGCNRYQIVHIEVTLPDGTKSSSKPYEYYVRGGQDGPITEKDGVNLMINCIKEKEMLTYVDVATSTDGFNLSANLTLERAGIYLTKVAAKDIFQGIEYESGDYGLLHYIMIFIDRDEYMKYGVGNKLITEKLVYKLIANANSAENLNTMYEKALGEIGNRLNRGQDF